MDYKIKTRFSYPIGYINKSETKIKTPEGWKHLNPKLKAIAEKLNELHMEEVQKKQNTSQEMYSKTLNELLKKNPEKAAAWNHYESLLNEKTGKNEYTGEGINKLQGDERRKIAQHQKALEKELFGGKTRTDVLFANENMLEPYTSNLDLWNKIITEKLTD